MTAEIYKRINGDFVLGDSEDEGAPEAALAFTVEQGERHIPTETELILRGVLRTTDGWFWEYPIEATTRNGGRFPYRLDFYNPVARLCIEVDGKHHYQRGRLRGRDRRRGTRLATMGIMTLRYSNRDVKQGLVQVLEQIEKTVKERI